MAHFHEVSGVSVTFLKLFEQNSNVCDNLVMLKKVTIETNTKG